MVREPRACSGDMYAGVPTAWPVSVSVVRAAVSSTNRAMPKSRTLTVSSGVTMTFAGLMSRWTSPARCAAAIASQICTPQVTACAGRGRPPARTAPSVRPWSRSMTR
ncbi:hypothetical protein SMD11_2784 [Streptomyces albireticuli]|uniref:Uncharacterized protein n=1 Tax=Streptomyces albireticuli TaxID=1940 RepID=A0A1Z2L282_9ACTN|nr:hypothetical protein SMD11_2784 [Streptomyces albireticuli]